jgi:transcriptional regulator with XRE-family HTH domain
MTTLRENRIRAGLSAFRLAEMAGTTEIRVYHIERARYRPRKEEAEGFSRALKRPVPVLFPQGCQPEGGTP